MTPEVILFWFLAAVALASALTVILVANPIFSALSLVMTMISIAALFVSLHAFFIAGVQLIVYAGAVMVLFVMVLMLFDLKQEVYAFARGKFTGLLKIGAVGMLAGLILGSVFVTAKSFSKPANVIDLAIAPDNSKTLGQLLFTQYLFVFEILGVLLLVVAIGTVALSRSRGGTHAK